MDAGATILAVSSPPGRSARGLIRLSGDDLQPHLADLLDPLPSPRTPTATRLKIPPGPTLQGGDHLSPSLDGKAAGPRVFFPRPLAPGPRPFLYLPCIALFHRAPNSFTGQDILELQMPGNPALLERILHVLLNLLPGARLAEPGEFTQRAFSAGRIDLTRAEGIAETISAVSDAQLQAANLLRRGRLGQAGESLVAELASALGRVEAGIDFIDQEDVVAITPADLDSRLTHIERQLADLVQHSRPWSALQSLPWVVIAGPPNAGKSTLFNALLGHRRAVTSPVAGTTRDVLTEPLCLEESGRSSEVMLVDLAGLEKAEAELDRAMQAAAAEALRRAELVLLLNDGSTPWVELQTESPILRVRTKCDQQSDRDVDAEAIAVSAVTGRGMEDLKQAVGGRMRQRAVSLGGQMLALQPRHATAIRQTLTHLSAARQMLVDQIDGGDLDQPELIATPMRDALDALGELGGHMSPDDVIGQVFATFCVGK